MKTAPDPAGAPGPDGAPAHTAEEWGDGYRTGTAPRQSVEPVTPLHPPSSFLLEAFFPSPSHSINTSHTGRGW